MKILSTNKRITPKLTVTKIKPKSLELVRKNMKTAAQGTAYYAAFTGCMAYFMTTMHSTFASVVSLAMGLLDAKIAVSRFGDFLSNATYLKNIAKRAKKIYR